MPEPNFSDTDFFQSSQDIAQKAAQVIDTAIRKAYQNLTPDERAKFATNPHAFSERMTVYRLARQLLINTAATALDNEFNSELIQGNKGLVAKILNKRSPHP